MSAGRVRRAGAVVLALVLATGGGAGTAVAAPPSAVVEVRESGPGSLRLEVRGQGLPAGVELRPDRVSARLAGRPVAVTASPLAAEGEQEDAARVLLVIDTSGSMLADDRIGTARAAAAGYLAAVPPDVEVGLLAFADAPALVVAPTRDRAAVRVALPALQADGETSLHDAVTAAAQALGPDGERRLVVLSDGADSVSRSTLSDAVTAVAASGAVVDAVVLGDQPEATAALEELAESGGGRVFEAASAVDATDAFAAAARALTSVLDVHLTVPPGLAGVPADVTVSVESSAGPVVGQARLTLPGSVVASEGDVPGAPGWLLPAGLAGLLLGLVAMLALAVLRGDTQAVGHRRSLDILHRYGRSAAATPAPQTRADGSRLGKSVVARSALELADRVVETRGLRQRLELRLDRAAVSLTPAEWVVLSTTVAVVLSALALVLAGSLLLAVGGGALGGLAAQLWLRRKAKRRAAAFVAAMPDALQLIASGLASGYSLAQALDAVVAEGREPLGPEFGRALAEARLGVPVEDALDAVADRMDCQDFRWVVMAIRVQREVGGNLAEVLATVCKTMRDRASLRRQVRALSAEGRLSAVVLIGLPVVLGLFMAVFRRDYFAVMWQTPVGLVLLLGCAAALAVGAVWMNKLVKVEM